MAEGQRPATIQVTQAMGADEMESKMANLCNKIDIHPALGRSPEDVAKHIQVVSLGSSCAVKMTLRRLGLDQATMPFDWIRTSAAGITHWLRDGFTDYFRSPFKRFEVIFRDLPMTVYRCETHSFWHDNIEDLETRQKLFRRVERFCQLGTESGRALLFVRSICGTGEVQESEAMYDALQLRFGAKGRQVYLLIVIDDQGLNGPILHTSYQRLLFWVKPLAQGPLATTGEGPGPYEDAVAWACRRILQDPSALMPGGRPGSGSWPAVASSREILQLGGVLRNHFGAALKDSEAGLWCGMVLRKDAKEQTMFCALEGYSHREISYASPLPREPHLAAPTALPQEVTVP